MRLSAGKRGHAKVELLGGAAGERDRARLLATVRHMLRLDDDLSAFYAVAGADDELAWVAHGAGRMLRSPTVFEDVVKTVCTTNCSWALTTKMTTALVEHLGDPAPDGRRAFPSAAAMAAADESFYREVARTGYRAPYFRELARSVAAGEVDLEALTDPELPDDDVEAQLLALPGIGPYGAAHVMLTSLGRYSRLVLDSWTRPTYAKLAGRKTKDATIERRFRRYGEWAGPRVLAVPDQGLGEGGAMIARVWRGATSAADAAEYAAYVETELEAARALPGNRGTLVLRRADGDRAEFVTVLLFDALENVQAFAGDDLERAVFYPEDDRYLVERELRVLHYDVDVSLT